MKPELNRLGYVPELDGLRALAIILVLFAHANFQIGKNGAIGIDVFFVLSGFLITTLILEERDKNGQINLKAFYSRRFFRLIPAVVLLLSFITFYAVFYKPNEQGAIIDEVISSFFYVYNIAWLWGAAEGILLGHTWSLAVEEQFYFIWPVAVILFLGSKHHKKFLLGLGLFIFSVAALKLTGNFSQLLRSLIHENIFLGCFLALMIKQFKLYRLSSFWYHLSLLLIIIIGLSHLSFYQHYFIKGSRLITGLLTSAIILGILQHKTSFANKILRSRYMVFVGKISYSLYLWHLPIFRWVKWHSELEPKYQFVLKFVLTLLMSVLSYFIIEKFFVKKGRKLSDSLIKN